MLASKERQMRGCEGKGAWECSRRKTLTDLDEDPSAEEHNRH